MKYGFPTPGLTGLDSARDDAARRAFRHYHERKNSPRHRIEGAGLYTVEGNPDLPDDYADFIADALILGARLGLDLRKVLRAAVSHVPAKLGDFDDVHSVLTPVTPRKSATIEGERVGGSGSSAVYEITATGDMGQKLDKATVSRDGARATVAAMTARLEADGYDVALDWIFPGTRPPA